MTYLGSCQECLNNELGGKERERDEKQIERDKKREKKSSLYATRALTDSNKNQRQAIPFAHPDSNGMNLTSISLSNNMAIKTHFYRIYITSRYIVSSIHATHFTITLQ